jgi:hypothetical protein
MRLADLKWEYSGHNGGTSKRCRIDLKDGKYITMLHACGATPPYYNMCLWYAKRDMVPATKRYHLGPLEAQCLLNHYLEGNDAAG